MMIAVVSGGLAVAGCDRREAADEATAANSDPAVPATTISNEPGALAPLAKSAADANLQWGPCPEGMPEGCGIAVLNGDPARPNADIFLRVPGGAAIPPHAHTSAERMILVSGQLDVKYQGAPGASLKTGDYAYGPPQMPHRADCRSSEPCTLFIAFEGPVDVLPHQGDL